MNGLLWPAINLLILVLVIRHFAKSPLKAFLVERRKSIATQLETAKKQLAEAKAKHDEFSSRLVAIEGEVSSIKSEAGKDGQKLKSEILSEAQRMSGVMVSDAKSQVSRLFDGLKQDLVREVADKVVAKAEKAIRERMTGDDRARLKKEFSSQVERSS